MSSYAHLLQRWVCFFFQIDNNNNNKHINDGDDDDGDNDNKLLTWTVLAVVIETLFKLA